jgi:serine/threonine protein kinase
VSPLSHTETCCHSTRRAAGEKLFPQCTLAYAPPEVIAAYNAHADVTVAAGHDIWALGVMAYEALAGKPAFPNARSLFAAARGAEAFPWAPSQRRSAPVGWRKSRLRSLVESCLKEDPAQRATVDDVLAGVAALCSTSTA